MIPNITLTKILAAEKLFKSNNARYFIEKILNASHGKNQAETMFIWVSAAKTPAEICRADLWVIGSSR